MHSRAGKLIMESHRRDVKYTEKDRNVDASAPGQL
jgi:hypothetical protein